MFIRDLGLRTKLLIIIALGTVGFIGLTSFGIYAISQIQIGSDLYRDLQSHQDILEKIRILESQLTEIRFLCVSMLAVNNVEELQQIKSRIRMRGEKVNKEFRKALGYLAAEKREPDVILAFNSARTTWITFYKTIMETEYMPDIFSGNNPEALNLILEKTKAMQEQFTLQIQKIASMMRREIGRRETEATRFVVRTVLFFGWSSVGLSVLIIALGLGVANIIIRPVVALTEVARKVSAGDLNQKAVVGSKDETGQLALAFNEMIDVRRAEEEKLKAAYAELKTAHDKLVEAEKFRVIGQMATGIAHEVKNPLAIILQSTNYLERKLASDPVYTEILVLIKESIDRADHIVHALSDFSKTDKLNLAAANINHLMDEAIGSLSENAGRANIRIEKKFDAGLPAILVDKKRMEQAIKNVLLNAIQAMPQGGALNIRTYGTRSPSPHHPDKRIICIEVEDTGIGIPNDQMRRLFEPFFTTKSPQQGMGLGLVITKNIIDMHGGFITIESVEHKGTKVVVGLNEEA